VKARKPRYGQLSNRALAQVVGFFVASQAIAWAFIQGIEARFAFAIITTAVLAVVVRTRKRPSR